MGLDYYTRQKSHPGIITPHFDQTLLLDLRSRFFRGLRLGHDQLPIDDPHLGRCAAGRRLLLRRGLINGGRGGFSCLGRFVMPLAPAFFL